MAATAAEDTVAAVVVAARAIRVAKKVISPVNARMVAAVEGKLYCMIQGFGIFCLPVLLSR